MGEYSRSVIQGRQPSGIREAKGGSRGGGAARGTRSGTYKGLEIGTSKVRGLFQKYDEESSDMKLLRYGDFLNDVSRAPFVTHDINTGEPTERDSWWKLYQQTSEKIVQRRVEDVKRITKFIATPKGVLWESRMAALEAIQQKVKTRSSRKLGEIQGGSKYGAEKGTAYSVAFGQLKALGATALQTINLTASTLAQVGVSGTGAHMDTYISRAYLRDGNSTGSDILDVLILGAQNVLGFKGGSGNKMNAAAAAIAGAEIPIHPASQSLLYQGDTVQLKKPDDPSSPVRTTGNFENKFYGANGSTLTSLKRDKKATETGVGEPNSTTVAPGIKSYFRARDKESLEEKNLYGSYKDTNPTYKVTSSRDVAKNNEGVKYGYSESLHGVTKIASTESIKYTASAQEAIDSVIRDRDKAELTSSSLYGRYREVSPKAVEYSASVEIAAEQDSKDYQENGRIVGTHILNTGVSTATASITSPASIGQLNSNLRDKDIENLGVDYGTVKEGTGSLLSDQKYIISKSLDILDPFNRVAIRRNTGSVRTLYDFDRVAALGYTGREGAHNAEYFRETGMAPDRINKAVTVVSPKGAKKIYNLPVDEIFELHYGGSQEKPFESADPGVRQADNLEWDSEQATVDKFSLIPFCITTITPDHRTYLNFPAYLESYEDSYDADWDSAQYVGRAEKFYGYKGFTRKINFSFNVIAKRRADIVPLYMKLNRLVGATAPSYDQSGLFMRGTMASVSIGSVNNGYGETPKDNGLLNNQLGFISSVRLSWDKDVPWEVDSKTYRVPHMLTVTVSFTPIEKEEVREDYGAYFLFNPNEIRNPIDLGPERDQEEEFEDERPVVDAVPITFPPRREVEIPETEYRVGNDSTYNSYNLISHGGNIHGGDNRALREQAKNDKVNMTDQGISDLMSLQDAVLRGEVPAEVPAEAPKSRSEFRGFGGGQFGGGGASGRFGASEEGGAGYSGGGQGGGAR